MGLSYPQQRSYALAGSKNSNSLAITPATLTTSYVGKKITTDYAAQAMIYVRYTPGAGGTGNYIMIKLEFSPDSVNDYQENSELVAAGTTTEYVQERKFDNAGSTVAGTTYTLRIPVELADRFLKFSVKETVVGGSAGAIFAEALISGK